MKRKLIILCIGLALILSILPATALAYDYGGLTYNDNDYNKLRTFLETESAVAGVKNGQQLNASYDPDDPATWTGITWNTAAEKRVTDIYVDSKSWAGNLDISNFTSLDDVFIPGNSIASIDASGCTLLNRLHCHANHVMTSLDVSGDTALTNLHCDANAITDINISGCTALTEFFCNGNLISSLDLGDAPSLDSLNCYGNSLTSLDVSANTALKSLNCYSNGLTSLDLSANTALKSLNCHDNNLTSLNLSANTALSSLICTDNNLTSLNLSANTALSTLNCSDNHLTSLDLSMNPNLVSLECAGNPLTSISAVLSGGAVNLTAEGRGYVALFVNMEVVTAKAGAQSGITFYNWTDASDAVVSTASNYNLVRGSAYELTANFQDYASNDYNKLRSFLNQTSADGVHTNGWQMNVAYDPNNPLTWTGITWNDDAAKRVTDIDVESQSLAGALDLGGFTSLTDLDCSRNAITSLDVSGDVSLVWLLCGLNDLTSINVTGCTNLLQIACDYNQLTTIDGLGDCTGLRALTFSHNKFTSIDLSACSPSQLLDSSDNELTHIVATIEGETVELAAATGGYVSLYYYYVGDFTASASPAAALINWTDGMGTEVSTAADFDLTPGQAYDLTANFLYLESSDSDGIIYTGGRITLTPSIAGGTWTYYSEYLSLHGTTFTARKEGAVTIIYTAGGYTAAYDVTIANSGLPSTGQNFTLIWLLAATALILVMAAIITNKSRRCAG